MRWLFLVLELQLALVPLGILEFKLQLVQQPAQGGARGVRKLVVRRLAEAQRAVLAGKADKTARDIGIAARDVVAQVDDPLKDQKGVVAVAGGEFALRAANRGHRGGRREPEALVFLLLDVEAERTGAEVEGLDERAAVPLCGDREFRLFAEADDAP